MFSPSLAHHSFLLSQALPDGVLWSPRLDQAQTPPSDATSFQAGVAPVAGSQGGAMPLPAKRSPRLGFPSGATRSQRVGCDAAAPGAHAHDG
jgi:hypothetical protein